MMRMICFLVLVLVLASGNLLADVDVKAMDTAAKAQGAEQFNADTLTWCREQGVEVDVQRILDGWIGRNRAVLEAAEKIVQQGESQYPNAREIIRNNAKKHTASAIASMEKMDRKKVVGFCIEHAESIERGEKDLKQEKFQALVSSA